MQPRSSRKRLGIIGGLGTLAGADLFFKLARATVADRHGDEGSGDCAGGICDIIFEQHPFKESGHAVPAGSEHAQPQGRKLYAFDMVRQFEQRKVDCVLMPCFISHTFIHELQAETQVPIADITQALRSHLARRYPEVRRVGILTSDYVRRKELFERRFADAGYTLLYPDVEVQSKCLMQAIYGVNGIQAGHLQGEALELLHQACAHLVEKGAEVIVAGATEIAIVAESLRERGMPVIDTNQAYAQYVLNNESELPAPAFKVGIIGGVGPAATVDFMNKIIRQTEARRDQDHIRLVVEHNPKIPDRTAALLGDGEDPTVALYAACKKLEANDADLIAIPCNTAHAFVERIQPHLAIPIVNMLDETVARIRRHYGTQVTVGLLATSGTVQSRVYYEAAARAGITMIMPDPPHQELVMHAIYGERGVKAGYTSGECKEALLCAMEHLAERGAQILILGCTELPLLVQQSENFAIGERQVAVLDPTLILAQRCVELAQRASRH